MVRDLMLLWDMEYRLQATRKSTAGASHPDRDAPFKHISPDCASQRKMPDVAR